MARIRPKIKKFKFPVSKRYWVYLTISIMLFVLAFILIYTMNPMISIVSLPVELLGFYFFIKSEKIYRKSIVQRQIDYYSKFKYVSIKPEDYDHIWFNYIHSERLLINVKDGKYLVYWQAFDCNDERWIEQIPEGEWYDSWEELKLDWIEDYGFINNDVEDEPTTGEENG